MAAGNVAEGRTAAGAAGTGAAVGRTGKGRHDRTTDHAGVPDKTTPGAASAQGAGAGAGSSAVAASTSAAGAAGAASTAARNDSLVVEATIAGLQEALAEGQLTSRQLVLAYLERIARIDREGPALNSILEINPDALFIADALDIERRRHGPRGPLHGIPVVVKDNIDTGDKMHTSAGSLALADSYAPEDSFVAAQLRRAGAIVLGKGNMTEWANFMTVNMPAGYSSRGGQVLNPYGPGKFTPGGSSSGSGASVAASLVTAAVGTETSGSILSPASANSVVGIKPTVGLVSRYGIIPIMHTQDTAGPLARTVKDAAILLTALVGVDERDPATLGSLGRTPEPLDYTRFLDGDALKGARLGVPRDLYEKLDADRMALMNAAIEIMRREGAEVVDPVPLPAAKEKMDNVAMVYEFKPNLNAYLRRLGSNVPVHSLRELIAFNLRRPESLLKFGQTLLVEAESKSGTLTEPEYIRSLMRNLHLSTVRGIDAALDEYRLDALVVPGNYGAGIAARAGYPSVSVPGGYSHEGHPLGVTFTAKAYSEPALIRLAYAFEQASKLRRPPAV